MQLSQIPSLVPLPFANSGTKNTIPTASQIGITAGAASLTDGFPPLTFTPIAAGGVPPFGADFNGILNLLSANTRWENAGGFYKYDSAFSTSIGGYPQGAVLLKATGIGYWVNLADNNTVDPDTVGTNWISFDAQTVQSGSLVYAVDSSATANTITIALTPIPTAIPKVIYFKAANSNTGATTVNVNGLGALNLYGAGAALAGGEIVAGGEYQAIYDGTQLNLIGSGSGALAVGSASKPNHAVPLAQLQAFVPISASATNSGSNTTASASVSFTAPTAGTMIVIGAVDYGVQDATTYPATLTANGSTIYTGTAQLGKTFMGKVAIPAGGAACTAQMTGQCGGSFSVHVLALFVPNPGSN